MEASKYQILLDKYGNKGTQELISVLNNYKGSSGKQYSDDYFAILKWVVEKVEKEKPYLLQSRKYVEENEENPYAEWAVAETVSVKN